MKFMYSSKSYTYTLTFHRSWVDVEFAFSFIIMIITPSSRHLRFHHLNAATIRLGTRLSFCHSNWRISVVHIMLNCYKKLTERKHVRLFVLLLFKRDWIQNIKHFCHLTTIVYFSCQGDSGPSGPRGFPGPKGDRVSGSCLAAVR